MLTTLLLAAIAATPTGGDPIDVENWIKATDFSLAAMQNRTDVVYELSFDPAGKVYRCEVITAGRNKLMEKTVCRALLKRAAATPLLDSKGKALPFIRRGQVRMRPRPGAAEGTRVASRESGADVVVNAPELPADLAALYVVALEIIDAAGTIETCILIEPSSSERVNKSACDIIGRPVLATPVKDASGHAIRGAHVFDLLFVPSNTETVKIR